SWRNLDDPTIYYDDSYISQLPPNTRDKFYRLATAYLQAGDKAKAKEVITRCLTVMPDKSIPYDYYTPQFIEPLVAVGEQKKAMGILNVMAARATKALSYYATDPNSALFDREVQTNFMILQQLIMSARAIGQEQKAAELEQIFMKFYGNR
ncbi:MAG: glycosyltransferase, partial [Adhaeribacter sp.]|nr:glycosyltransferase [Adhaeribacter sp.]